MLTLIDNITIVLCVVGIFAISIFMSKKNTDMEAYYHANKALPWSLAVGTIAASWYGGNGTIGTVGYVTTMGLSAFFIWSIGAHLVRFPLALWVAPRISVKVNSTMTELLDRFYGRIASFIGAIVLLATCLSISEIGACGYAGVAAWNMNKFLAAAIVIAISIGLSCVGGLLGVAITDMIFFFLMIVSVAFVFPSAFYGVGGFAALDEIFSTVDPSMMTPFGGIPLGRAIVLILICINVYKDPAFYQRFTASNGPKTGKRAMLTCFSIWLSMDVCLMFTAIVIRAMDPALTVQPEVAYMQFVLSGLPPVGRGLFVFAMLGAIISTAIFWLVPDTASAWVLAIPFTLIAFFIYGPQALLGIAAANQATKEAAASANGILGIFGYASTLISGVGFGYVADHYGWGSTYIVILAFAVVGMLTIATIWNAKGDGYEAAAKFNAEREKKINLQA